MTKRIGYVAAVTEYESGWGQRPAGYILCLDKQKGLEFATRENGKVWSMEDGSEFSIAGDFKLCVLTERGFEYLEQYDNQLAWIEESELYGSYGYVEKES